MKASGKILAPLLAVAAVLLFVEGGMATFIGGIACLAVAVAIFIRPASTGAANASAVAEKDMLQHGNPSRDTTRSDYFLHGPGGGFGDGGV